MTRKKDRKTETLSLRLDPKTKFMLEFVARINGQTLTTIVERSIRSSLGAVHTGGNIPRDWTHFWDPQEGIRTLKLLQCNEYPTTPDEDDLKKFVTIHWPFFYASRTFEEPHRVYVEILWPKIAQYRRIWGERRNRDFWAAGDAMAATLSAAKVQPPEFPRGIIVRKGQKPIRVRFDQ